MIRVAVKRSLLVSCILLYIGQDAVLISRQAFAQRQTLRPFRLGQSERTSFTLTVGVTSPQGRAGLREFWLSGPGGSAKFNVHLNQRFSIGVGTDWSLLYFDENAFGQRWPGVTLTGKKNLVIGNAYFDATYSLFPTQRTRPFVSTQVGAVLISEASSIEVVDGVRRRYYDVGGRPRLTLGVAAGANIVLNSALGLLIEIKGTFVHNDPNVSALAQGRVGLQFKI